MIIEHNGKKLDTERPIRQIEFNAVAVYAGYMPNLQRHVVEMFSPISGTWCYVTPKDAALVDDFENIPEKRVTELFVVMWPESFAVYREYEPAKDQFDKHSLAAMQRVCHVWEV